MHIPSSRYVGLVAADPYPDVWDHTQQQQHYDALPHCGNEDCNRFAAACLANQCQGGCINKKKEPVQVVL